LASFSPHCLSLALPVTPAVSPRSAFVMFAL
jgi:hypothetical protein